ncbi:hypothetical protein BRD00_10335 [Halobacteriales archaeon QS_8_69_26]|nr:MAG: hypothetical protein BRD00_10335 [Halobacteriales archaeon QS_8_69_26]
MDEPSTDDAVVLHLDGLDPTDSADDPAPLARSLPGIWAGLGVRAAAVGDRVAVLSALRDLVADGLVERRVGRVESLDGRRYVYALTDAGFEQARDIRERVADRRVTVGHEDRSREVCLGTVDRVLDPPAGGAVAAATPADDPVRFEGPADTVADPGAWALANATDGTVRAGPRGVGERFVDRGPELGRFGAVLDAAATGRTEPVLVTGGAGAGKSSLLERGAAVARERGFAVGVATATADDPPYGPVLRALSGVADPERVAEAFDSHAGRPVEDPGERRSRRAALAGELADLIRDTAADGPVMLAVDDLGDADRPSLAVLGDFADRLDDAPVVLAGVVDDTATREGPLGEFLAALDGETRIPLDPLGGDDVAGVVAHLLADPDPPASLVEGVADRSGGNPLLAAETVRYCLAVGDRHDLLASGDDDPSPDPYPDPRDDVPDSVAGIVDRRIDGLPDPAVAVLEAAAVAGGAVHVRVLAAAIDRQVPDLHEWVDLLAGAGLFVRRAGGEVRFAGDAVREVTLDRLEGERERTLHRRIAAAVEDVAEPGDGQTGTWRPPTGPASATPTAWPPRPWRRRPTWPGRWATTRH